MKKTLPLLLTIILSSCVSTRDVYTPSGSIVYGLTCHVNSQQSCFEKAGELCGTLGYRLVSADGTPLPAPPPAPAPTSAPAHAPMSASTMDMKPADANSTPADDTGIKLTRDMYVQCHSN